MKRSVLAFLFSTLVLVITSCASHDVRETSATAEDPDRVMNRGHLDRK